MMSSSCRARGGCVDVHAPTKLRSTKLYRWAESDAEFLRLISVKEGCGASPGIHVGSPLQSPQLGRQKYLRSYTFSRQEETVSERTRRWLQEKKELKKKKKKLGSSYSQGFGGAVVREVKETLVGASCFVFGAVVRYCFLRCRSEHRC
ncbi:hypothetical protein Taro_051103 [Colocasia esculenta]|uniref:Uncharacterized protein n=1 Tax=Colocasia esculenta TaxID=4460 RepID=A0A843XFY3_COLES|nr:hypothetical protein [Colocasia esculenta]